MTLSRTLGALLCLVSCALPAAAQAPGTGWLHGRVLRAEGGAAVEDAHVRATGPVEGSARSGPDGRWRIGPLPAGRYRLRVEHIGYAPVRREVTVAPEGGAGAEGDAEREAGPVEIRLVARPLALDALVVTAARREQRLAETTVATELVSAREIRETGAADLSAVLTERAGLVLEGGHPTGAGVMIQGMGSERVLVLLDGQPFIGRISGSLDLSRIPTSMIERVEVVKGPQSTLYGSAAMGGVVNVITRDPASAAWSASGRATGGDHGRLDLSLDALGGLGPVRGVVDLGHRSLRLAPGTPGEAGGLAERWDGLARLSWRAPADGLRVDASGLLLDERQRWRTGQLNHFADNVQWIGRLGATFERGRHRLVPTAVVTVFDHLSRSATGAEPVPGTGERDVQRLAEGEVLYGLELGRHALDAGVELRRESVRSDRVAGGEREQRMLESFVQATLAWDRGSIVPGIRVSRSDPWGTHWTPRVAAVVRPTAATAVRLAAGAGFRAPAFKELYMEFLNVGPGFGYTVRGNPDLRPEVSRNLTGSAEWSGARGWLRVQAFENRFDDFIETRAAGDSSGITVYTYGNVDDGFTRGAELEGGITVDGWRVEAGWSVLRAERTGTGEPLLGRPRSSGRLAVRHARADGLTVSLTAVRTGRTAMARTADATDWRDPFLRFDLRAARPLPGGFELSAGVDNVLDAQIDDWPGFTGRHLYTSLAWRRSGEPREMR